MSTPTINPYQQCWQGYFTALQDMLPELNSRHAAPRSVAHSLYTQPISAQPGEPRGYNRNHGGASASTKADVLTRILAATRGMSNEDRAVLLGIVAIESGFNPDAANPKSSAAGLFQMIDATAASLGVAAADRFSTNENIYAGIALFEQHRTSVKQRRSAPATANERAALLYALHHDGPALNSGGRAIARNKLLPLLPSYRALVQQFEAGWNCEIDIGSILRYKQPGQLIQERDTYGTW